MSKTKNVAISVTVGLILTITTFLSILYINDFRYSSEDGIYKIIERASDLSEEERSRRHLSDDYVYKVTNISIDSIGNYF